MRHCSNQGRSIKQYSTIEILCEYKDNDGAGLSLADTNIRSDMYSQNGRFIDTLTVQVLDEAAGVFMLTPTINKLPVGKLSIDVIFEKDGKMVTSDTFSIDVELAITNPFTGG